MLLSLASLRHTRPRRVPRLRDSLGPDRPAFRWLIVGPQRSGSVFHVDPNATSAWNACIVGAKKWVLFPPHFPPPGVHASADGAEVATTMSPMEWFIDWYAVARKAAGRAERDRAKARLEGRSSVGSSHAPADHHSVPPKHRRRDVAHSTVRRGMRRDASRSSDAASRSLRAAADAYDGPLMLEGMCRAGEIVWVPTGWWHLVLCTEDSVAITQVRLLGSSCDLKQLQRCPPRSPAAELRLARDAAPRPSLPPGQAVRGLWRTSRGRRQPARPSRSSSPCAAPCGSR